MPRKLFVGGLSRETTGESLRDLFSKFGELVEVKLITDRKTGESRRFAFVAFVNEKEAEDALFGLHRTVLDGYTIRISMAEDRRPPHHR